ncbi:35980_t:CDS:2, partial [Gigaspora margarita]
NSKSSHATYLLSNLDGVKVSDLSWDDPLANRIVDANSKYVKEIPDHALESFMEPEVNMRVSAPDFIREKCDEIDSEEILPAKLTHNESWKELDEVLNRVTTGILDLLNEIWKNPAFGPELAGTQNEGTYVTDIINGKALPVRIEKGSQERENVCTEEKEKTDQVKLWREMNDGLFWSRKACKPDKGEFGIISIQVAETDNVHCLYRLRSAEIPVQKVDESQKLIGVKNSSCAHDQPKSDSEETLLKTKICLSTTTSIPLSHTSNSEDEDWNKNNDINTILSDDAGYYYDLGSKNKAEISKDISQSEDAPASEFLLETKISAS